MLSPEGLDDLGSTTLSVPFPILPHVVSTLSYAVSILESQLFSFGGVSFVLL